MKLKNYFFILLLLPVFLYSDPPEWEVIGGTQYNMIVMASANLNSSFFDGSEDNMIGAFGPNGISDCRGLGIWVDANPPHHNGLWYFTIVGNETVSDDIEISFKLYDTTTDQIFDCNETITFENNATIGTPDNLFQLTTDLIELGSIQGHIILQGGNGNVEDVVISASSYSTQPYSNGFYNLDIPEGVYDITAYHENYSSQTISNIIVESGEITPNIDFVIYPDGDIGLFLPEEINTSQGAVLQIPLQLVNPVNIDIEGITLQLSYDESALEISGINIDDGELDQQDYDYQFSNENGVIDLWIYLVGQPFSSEGNLFYLNAEIYENTPVGTTTGISVSEATINEGEVNTNSCLISVFGDYNVDGEVHYYNTDNPIQNVQVTLYGTNNYTYETTIDGSYEFNSVPAGNYFSTASKDNELNGLSSMDASRIARFGVGLFTLDAFQQIAADVTLNGEITATDASRVARYVTGVISTLNSLNKDWVFVNNEALNPNDWPPIEYENSYIYDPLHIDEVDQNFSGIRLGDVTGNWVAESFQRNREISVSLPDIEVEQGEQFEIPLQVEDLQNLEGLDITLNFDNDVIDAQNINFENSIIDEESFSYSLNVNQDGLFVISLYATNETFSGSGVLFNLVFDAIGNTNDTTLIEFAQLSINEIDYTDNATNGSVIIIAADSDLVQIPHYVTTLIGNHPNPFNPETEISFYLADTSDAEIQIFNVKGQIIRNLILNNLTSGYHSITWDGKDSTMHNVANGLYFYRLLADRKSKIKKMILLK